MSPTLSMIHLVPGTAVTVVVDVSGTPTTVQGTVRQLDGNLVLVDLRVPVADEAQGLRRSPRLNRRRRRPDEGRTKIKHQASGSLLRTALPSPRRPSRMIGLCTIRYTVSFPLKSSADGAAVVMRVQ